MYFNVDEEEHEWNQVSLLYKNGKDQNENEDETNSETSKNELKNLYYNMELTPSIELPDNILITKKCSSYQEKFMSICCLSYTNYVG